MFGVGESTVCTVVREMFGVGESTVCAVVRHGRRNVWCRRVYCVCCGNTLYDIGIELPM